MLKCMPLSQNLTHEHAQTLVPIVQLHGVGISIVQSVDRVA